MSEVGTSSAQSMVTEIAFHACAKSCPVSITMAYGVLSTAEDECDVVHNINNTCVYN